MQNLTQEILEYLQKIPKWKVSTYKLMADAFWVHPRKISQTMRYNKFPEIYPCYKIVAHNGNISGYSGDGWVEAKIKKLQNDGVEVLNGKVDEKYFWK